MMILGLGCSVDCAGFAYPAGELQTAKGERIAMRRKMLLRRGIEQASVFAEHVGNFYRKRRVEVHGYWRKRPFFHHYIELKKQQLCALKREGRNEEDSFACARIFDALPQFLATLRAAVVHAVAVHALHHKIIRARGKFRVM